MLDKVVVLDNLTCEEVALREGSIKAKRALTEHDMSTVKPRCDDGSDKELRPVGVLASVRHREDTRLGVLDIEIFI